MKTHIRKIIAIGVIMATFMSVLLGCDLDKKAVDPILTQLSEKYQKTFTIDSLGDRIGKDTATAYVSAEEDSSMRFVARVDTEGNLVYENYAYRTVCRQAEDLVAAAFKAYNMNAVCYCTFSPFYNDIAPGTTPAAYIQTAKPKDLFISLVLEDNGSLNAADIRAVYEKLYGTFDNVFLAVGMCVVSERDYAAVQDEIRMETQDFDAYRLSLYGTQDPVNEIILQVSANGVSLTEVELAAALAGEGTDG